MPIPGLEKVQTDPRIVSFILATEDVENKRREQAQRDQSNAMTLKAQQAGVKEAERKTMVSTMAADAAEWAKTPEYAGKSFAEALKEPEVGSHFGTDVYGDAAADAPRAWNAAQQAVTGKPPAIPGMPLAGATTKDGETTYQYETPKELLTGKITEKDVADAGLDPNSIPRNEWPGAVAKAKAGREGKMTEMQSNALQYSARMAYNRDILEKLEREGFNPAAIGSSIRGALPNVTQNASIQTYKAARDNWVSAVLRKESGAAISKSEYENAYRQYFPQMGDAPEVIQQKANLRKIAEDNMKLVAGGRAAEAETGVPGTGKSKQAQPQGKPKTVRQNGVIYTLGEDGQYH